MCRFLAASESPWQGLCCVADESWWVFFFVLLASHCAGVVCLLFRLRVGRGGFGLVDFVVGESRWVGLPAMVFRLH